MLLEWTIIVITVSSQLSMNRQCVYYPSNFSVNSTNPINPLTNCLQYCREYYAQTPQRGYYNLTSQDCQPVRLCRQNKDYYNYAKNQCYKDENFTQIAESYIPETLVGDGVVIAHQLSQMVCVNGNYNIIKVGFPAICNCNLLWTSSYKLDMNGYPFFCDKVTNNPALFFSGQLVYDKNKKITKYGPFKAQQMQILLANLRSLQYSQNYQYTLNQTQSILYAVNKNLPQQPLIRTYQYLYLAIFFVIALIILSISYYEYEQLKVKITQSKIKKRILQALQEQNYIRSIS